MNIKLHYYTNNPDITPEMTLKEKLIKGCDGWIDYRLHIGAAFDKSEEFVTTCLSLGCKTFGDIREMYATIMNNRLYLIPDYLTPDETTLEIDKNTGLCKCECTVNLTQLISEAQKVYLTKSAALCDI